MKKLYSSPILTKILLDITPVQLVSSTGPQGATSGGGGIDHLIPGKSGVSQNEDVINNATIPPLTNVGNSGDTPF